LIVGCRASWTIGWLWSSGAVNHLVRIGEHMVFDYEEWALYGSSLYTNGGGTAYSTSSETGPSPKLAFAMLLEILIEVSPINDAMRV